MPAQSNPVPPPSWRVRAIPTLAAAAAIVVFVLAGNWQHRRMLEKDALRAALDAAMAQPPVALPGAATDWPQWRFRAVTLQGRFDAARQIFIDNRIDAGRVGYHVVTPFVLDDGRAVLVDRGFVPAGPDRRVLPAAPVPGGVLTVHGRVAVPERYVELASAAPEGVLWQNLDPARFAAATGLPVLPIVVELDAADTAGGTLARNWPAPDYGRERHLNYMIQWYAFATLTAGLWGYFTWRRRR
ncbi:MAG: SURF1 family protein [Proteobacteria bacterium]|nr:SURF1 family protein [Pseudomonadota bacterium]